MCSSVRHAQGSTRKPPAPPTPTVAPRVEQQRRAGSQSSLARGRCWGVAHSSACSLHKASAWPLCRSMGGKLCSRVLARPLILAQPKRLQPPPEAPGGGDVLAWTSLSVEASGKDRLPGTPCQAVWLRCPDLLQLGAGVRPRGRDLRSQWQCDGGGHLELWQRLRVGVPGGRVGLRSLAADGKSLSGSSSTASTHYFVGW